MTEQYPEHEKLDRYESEENVIADFLEFLQYKNIKLIRDEKEADYRDIIFEYFGINKEAYDLETKRSIEKHKTNA